MDAIQMYSNNGPLVKTLESRYAELLNVDATQVVTVANATLGLEGAIRQAHAETWVVPAYSFPATAHAVRNASRSLTFVDVSPSDWALDISPITNNNDLGLVPVCPFGAPVDLTKWLGYEHVVIDAAASLGELPDLHALPSTWAVVFSLHATKVLPAGEGGLAIFGNSEAAARFRAWTNFGFRGSRSSQIQATNAKMSEIHAAYALASLDEWPTARQEWITARELANAALPEMSLSTPASRDDSVNPYWLARFPDRVTTERAITSLKEAAIESRIWWDFLPSMQAFQGVAKERCPVAAELAGCVIGLPFWRGLQPSASWQISEALSELQRFDSVGSIVMARADV